MKVEAETGGQPRAKERGWPAAQEWERGLGQIPSQSLQSSVALLTPRFQTADLQNCKGINFCLF